jgi:hypothetical protein
MPDNRNLKRKSSLSKKSWKHLNLDLYPKYRGQVDQLIHERASFK